MSLIGKPRTLRPRTGPQVVVSFTLSRRLVDKLEAHCAKTGESPSAWVERSLQINFRDFVPEPR